MEHEAIGEKQREAFIEISDWFYGRSGFDNGLFAFRTMCKLLEIDPVRVIKRLGSVRARDLPAPVASRGHLSPALPPCGAMRNQRSRSATKEGYGEK